MKEKRKMAMVVNQIRIDTEDNRDVQFWLGKCASERLAEVSRLRRNYFLWADGVFPERIEKVVYKREL